MYLREPAREVITNLPVTTITIAHVDTALYAGRCILIDYFYIALPLGSGLRFQAGHGTDSGGPQQGQPQQKEKDTGKDRSTDTADAGPAGFLIPGRKV